METVRCGGGGGGVGDFLSLKLSGPSMALVSIPPKFVLFTNGKDSLLTATDDIGDIDIFSCFSRYS